MVKSLPITPQNDRASTMGSKVVSSAFMRVAPLPLPTSPPNGKSDHQSLVALSTPKIWNDQRTPHRISFTPLTSSIFPLCSHFSFFFVENAKSLKSGQQPPFPPMGQMPSALCFPSSPTASAPLAHCGGATRDGDLATVEPCWLRSYETHCKEMTRRQRYATLGGSWGGGGLPRASRG